MKRGAWGRNGPFRRRSADGVLAAAANKPFPENEQCCQAAAPEPLLLALPAVAGLAVIGGGAALGYRAAYRHSLRKLAESLERMLQAVEAHARTGGGFTRSPGAVAARADDGGAGDTAAWIASTGA